MTDAPSNLGQVLVVDDDEFAREVIASLLRRAMPGVTVLTADRGETGLTSFRQHKPDLVITDLRMIGMSGAELIEQIRATDRSTPIFAITGAPDVLAVPGATEVVLKTEFKHLIDRVVSLMQRSASV